jgi:hypothetical protein
LSGVRLHVAVNVRADASVADSLARRIRRLSSTELDELVLQALPCCVLPSLHLEHFTVFEKLIAVLKSEFLDVTVWATVIKYLVKFLVEITFHVGNMFIQLFNVRSGQRSDNVTWSVISCNSAFLWYALILFTHWLVVPSVVFLICA